MDWAGHEPRRAAGQNWTCTSAIGRVQLMAVSINGLEDRGQAGHVLVEGALGLLVGQAGELVLLGVEGVRPLLLHVAGDAHVIVLYVPGVLVLLLLLTIGVIVLFIAVRPLAIHVHRHLSIQPRCKSGKQGFSPPPQLYHFLKCISVFVSAVLEDLSGRCYPNILSYKFHQARMAEDSDWAQIGRAHV